MAQDAEQLEKESASLNPQQLLEWVAEKWGKSAALASSLGAEDQVLTDMISVIGRKPGPEIFTLDTGRLPAETYDTIEAVAQRYGIRIKMLFPDYAKVEEMTGRLGPNLFYQSIENRKLCCRIRKLEPLQRELAGRSAWITGLRREQSPTRQLVRRIEWDETHKLYKINPLADWSTQQVWDYIRANKVPYNSLHDRGYPSIGCAPCTRAIEPGQDIRAGRWWWEEPEHKECGLHLHEGKLVRAAREQ